MVQFIVLKFHCAAPLWLCATCEACNGLKELKEYFFFIFLRFRAFRLRHTFFRKFSWARSAKRKTRANMLRQTVTLATAILLFYQNWLAYQSYDNTYIWWKPSYHSSNLCLNKMLSTLVLLVISFINWNGNNYLNY